MQPLPEAHPPEPGRKLKLLLVTDEMELGGTQRQIVHLARGLQQQGHSVNVVFFRERSHFVDDLLRDGVRVMQLPKRGRFDRRFFVAFVDELKSGRYDVVHAFALSAEAWTALALRAVPRRQRPPLITSIRGSYDWYSRLQWRVKRWISQQSVRVVANSRMAAAFACEHMRWTAAAPDVVYNGVAAEAASLGARETLRRSWHIADSTPLALYLGRLVDVKDVGVLIRACGRLKDEGQPVALVIGGDGPLMPELQDLVAALHLQGQVRFLGQRSDVADLVEAADLLVLSSRQEGLSNAILEAMRGARPVVATRTGGNVELVEHEVTGLLVEVGDVEGMAAAIRRLAADPELRSRMGRRASERASASFSVPSMVESVLAIYREVIHQPSHGFGGAGR